MCTYQTLDEKLNFIYSLEAAEFPSHNDWNKLETLVKDTAPEVRLQTSELLAIFPSKQSEELLLSILDDKDYLVRASVCDSLSFSNSPKTINLILKYTKDKRYLVRGYAVLSIADIQCNIGTSSRIIVDFLKNLYQKESSEWVRIAIARSLYLLGDKTYGIYLVEMLTSRYYKNRCFVLSLLEGFEKSEISSLVPSLLPILNRRLNCEQANSVKCKMQSLLQRIS